MSDAGVSAVWPRLSKPGAPIEGRSPLQSYADNLNASRLAMAACRVIAFAFSPLNVIPKLALGKLVVRELSGALALVSPDGSHRVLPLADVKTYHAAVLELLAERRALLLLPEWLASALKAHCKIVKQHDEFIMRSSDVVTPPGPANAKLRYNLKHVRSRVTATPFAPELSAEFLAVNRTWYRQNAATKFRTYDKTSIDWLIANWPTVQAIVPEARLIGVRDNETAKLIAFSAGSALAGDYWTSYTNRFDREALKGCAPICHALLAEAFAAIPFEDNGTADTTALRQNKDRLAFGRLRVFKV